MTLTIIQMQKTGKNVGVRKKEKRKREEEKKKTARGVQIFIYAINITRGWLYAEDAYLLQQR